MPSRLKSILSALALFAILAAGAFLRFSYLRWDEFTYMHPDERFLIWVTADMRPVESLGDFFDTATSTLNPHNVGHTFFVYGTFPLFLTRYLTEWLREGPIGWEEIALTGRALSALFDLGTILLVYLTAAALSRRRVALLAAAFYAFAVLPIQLSHFYKEDTFLNFFAMLAVYFAASMVDGGRWTVDGRRRTADDGRRTTDGGQRSTVNGLQSTVSGQDAKPPAPPNPQPPNPLTPNPLTPNLLTPNLLTLSAAFGIALGLATASKLNAAPVAIVLPLALLVVWLRLPPRERRRVEIPFLGYLALAAVVSLLVFRVAQPYAFSGPGFFGLKPNKAWVDNIIEQRNQAAGDVDFPPALQWARRSHLFGWYNLTAWGLGWPLGLLAWAGFLWVGWRILQGERRYLPLWGWAAFYFLWQSAQFNPTMRYFLPLYPLLAIFAAAVVFPLPRWGRGAGHVHRKESAGQGVRLLLRWGRGAGRVRRKESAGQGVRLLLRWGRGAGRGHRTESAGQDARPLPRWGRGAGVGAALLILLATAAYAFAFRNVYAQGFTRAEASRWIYQHIPGPLNLSIETAAGRYSQPLAVPYDFVLRPEAPLHTQFTARESGTLSAVRLGRVLDRARHPEAQTFRLLVSLTGDGTQVVALAETALNPAGADEEPPVFSLDHALPVNSGETLYFALLPADGTWPGLQGELNLEIQTPTEVLTAPLDAAQFAPSGIFIPYTFTADGTLQDISLRASLPPAPPPSPKTLTLTLSRNPDGSQPLASASLTDTFEQPVAADGSEFSLPLDTPVRLEEGETVYLQLSVQGEGAALALQGAGLANEGDWDDGLPLRMDGYDGFGGLYPRDLNFNMYWDDNPDKLARFERILEQADYIAISSSRQWATLPRLPERFPMTTLYYRHLLGCPAEKSIEWCYNVAQPGDFGGDLGFDLVYVEQHNPVLGPLNINDQFAEEAFTVYDHPKVFIFRKNADYAPQKVAAILGSVDFSRVIRVTPKKAAPHPMDLLLPEERLALQREGGTWRELFNPQSPLNRFHPLGVAVWYLVLALLGVAVYPLVRLALAPLPDRGYPLARLSGMLLLAWGVWLAASYEIPFERPLIAAVLAVIILAGIIVGYTQRADLKAEWRERRGYFLRVEILALAAFLLLLFLRWGNPDLWHPWKGGEKPMDFSYFNAVLKSTTFPPYDPWYAGGYINYYYYGFVLVGVLVKFLGLVPAFAYNLLIPTLFMLIVLGAFSLGVNLTGDGGRGTTDNGRWTGDGGRWTMDGGRGTTDDGRRTTVHRLRSTVYGPPSTVHRLQSTVHGLAGGLLAALAVGVLGNLGTVRMIWRGYQMLAAPAPTNEAIAHLGVFTRLLWGLQGMLRSLAGASLPYGVADWYWLPSRAIPPLGDVEPITEFPAFTVIYADLHAHLIALPITLLALAFALAVVYAWRKGQRMPWMGVFLGALAVGALKPTNTWDWPTYLALAVVALGVAALAPAPSPTPSPLPLRGRGWGQASPLPRGGRGRGWGKGNLLLFLALVFTLYRPYDLWFGSGYNKVDWWFGPKTPLPAYFVHWGGFLFVILSWMAYETLHWMATTPLSALGKLRPYRNRIYGALAALGTLMLLLALPVPGVDTPPLRDAIPVAWVVIPLGTWVLALLFNPRLTTAKRVTLFFTGTALALTLVVEIIVLRGDIGRMNTVFKFYYQGWTLLALSAAASLYWFFREALPRWRGGGALAWQAVLLLLAAGMSLYPVLGGTAKFKDRMTPDAPHTLDGMAYMPYAEYYDQDGPYPLRPDYEAIRWMQENVQGSPVIAEGNTPEYRWGTRYTIYTGLPGVVGWNWHQRQQRGGVVPADWVTNRIGEVTLFYSVEDPRAACDFLRKYDVRYFVVGALERAYYPEAGLAKFAASEGGCWEPVFQYEGTRVYAVERP